MNKTLTRLLLCILGVSVVLGAILYFAPLYAQNSSSLTVQAGNDASYSSGSRKWEFLYEPSFGSPSESNTNFPFPFFPINPSEAEMYGGKPVLLTVCTTSGVAQIDGTVLNATVGISRSFDGMEITVATANSSNAVLVLKTLP